MQSIVQISCVSLLCLLVLVSQVKSDGDDDSYLLVDEDKGHFACKLTKDAAGYSRLPIESLCDGEPDCYKGVDEKEGCKKKERLKYRKKSTGHGNEL